MASALQSILSASGSDFTGNLRDEEFLSVQLKPKLSEFMMFSEEDSLSTYFFFFSKEIRKKRRQH